MDGYSIAWWVIAGSGVIGGIAVFRLLRMIRRGLVRWLGMAVALAFFCTPAPVPEYPGQWAPAFVVAIFEALFQTDGSPVQSIRILVLVLGVVTLSTVLLYFVLQRWLGEDETQREDAAPRPSEPDPAN